MSITSLALIAVLLILGTLGQLAADASESSLLKTADVHIRDPFILAVPSEKLYYMYGTTHIVRPFISLSTYVSRDLKLWEGPIDVFVPDKDFWADRTFWAAEVHAYKGKYYMFATFGAEKVMRACQILVSNSPRGPFKPLTDRPVTPFGWQCLDGTLYIDKRGKPWMVFCHEWEQTKDGEICAMQLTNDLKYAAGKPHLLFKASDAPWVVDAPWTKPQAGERLTVTDGPFLTTSPSGKLLMMWSSFTKDGYAVGLAVSENGSVLGPWQQSKEPIYNKDGGHSMLFQDFNGKTFISMHAPNKSNRERPLFLPVEIKSNTIIIKG